MENLAVTILSDDVIKALCTTLLHSLWQGLILAAFAGLVITCTRKFTPGRRYNLLIGGLVVFAGVTICTFFIELNQGAVHGDTPAAFQAQRSGRISVVKTAPVIVPNASLPEAVTGYLNKHAYGIVLVWLLIVVARSLQLIIGLHGLYHLRRKAMFTIDSDWENRVKVMADKMGIQRMVNIAESGIAKVPMVIGHLKPLILLPIGLITAMPPAEIEAILVHELAHIRRRDYLVNLLQSLMEILFFFNPAVLWLSALIRTERENCCDDIAITQTSNKVNYIRALVSCQEYRLSAPAYAMALKGKKKHLLARVKRLASGSNQSLNVMEKSLLAICLVIAGFLTMAFSNTEKINKLLNAKTKANHYVEANLKKQIITKRETFTSNKAALHIPDMGDSLKNNKTIRTDTLLTKRMRAVDREKQRINVQKSKRDSLNREFALHTRKLDSERAKWDALKPKRDSLDRELALQAQKLDREREKTARKAQRLDSNRQVLALQAQKLDSATLKVARLNKLESEKNREQSRLNELESAKNKEQSRLNRLESEKNKEQSTINKIQSEKNKEQSRINKEQSFNLRRDTLVKKMKSEQKKERPRLIQSIDSSKRFEKKNARPAKSAIPPKSAMPAKSAKPASSASIADLKDNKEFIVNGTKQPDNVYQKYQAGYFKGKGNKSYSWNYKYDSTTYKK